MAERGIMVSYETVRRWVRHLRRRPKPHSIWHLDEVFIKIDGRLVYLWRTVDAEGEVLDVLVQSKRDKRTALKLIRKLLKKMGFAPDRIVTDDLRSYGAAMRDLGISRLITSSGRVRLGVYSGSTGTKVDQVPQNVWHTRSFD